MKTLFLVFVFFVLSAFLSATIINIPADQPTIQAGINVAVAEHPAGEPSHPIGHPLVALPKTVGGCRSARREDRASQLVDSQLVRRLNELAVVRLPCRAASMIQVRMTVYDLAFAKRVARLAGYRLLAGSGSC